MPPRRGRGRPKTRTTGAKPVEEPVEAETGVRNEDAGADSDTEGGDASDETPPPPARGRRRKRGATPDPVPVEDGAEEEEEAPVLLTRRCRPMSGHRGDSPPPLPDHCAMAADKGEKPPADGELLAVPLQRQKNRRMGGGSWSANLPTLPTASSNDLTRGLPNGLRTISPVSSEPAALSPVASNVGVDNPVPLQRCQCSNNAQPMQIGPAKVVPRAMSMTKATQGTCHRCGLKEAAGDSDCKNCDRNFCNSCVNKRMPRGVKNIVKGSFASSSKSSSPSTTSSRSQDTLSSASNTSRRETFRRCMEEAQDQEIQEDVQEDKRGGAFVGQKQQMIRTSENEEDEGDGTGMGDVAPSFRYRSSNTIPPAVPPQQRSRITPIGDWQWDDLDWDGRRHRRQPNAVLGAICRHHYPGLVTIKGEEKPATKWEHYKIAPHDTFENIAGVVWHEFWERYRLPDDHDTTLATRAHKVFHKAAQKVVKDMMSSARIRAVCLFYKQKLGQMMNQKLGASKIYLKEDQYRQVMVPWMVKCSDAYYAFCSYWASREFQEKSSSKRSNREAGGEVPHRFGGGGHIRLSKRMAAESGKESSSIDAYVRGHRGTDDSGQLCTPTATQNLEKYAKEVVRRHGDDYDWRKQDVDGVALYQSSEGKRHGRYSMFNGIMNSDVVLSKSRSTQSKQGYSRHMLPEDQSRLKQMEEEQAALRDHMRVQQDHMRVQQECMKAQHDYFTNLATWQQAMHGCLSQLGVSVALPPLPTPPLLTMPPPLPMPPPQTHVSLSKPQRLQSPVINMHTSSPGGHDGGEDSS